MTTNYGGGFGGFGGFGGGRGSGLDDRRRREIRQMANAGTSALLKEPSQVTRPAPPMSGEAESRKADDAGIISTGLNSVFKLMDWWDSNIAKPSAALGLSMMPSMSFIEGEDARVQRSRKVVSSALSGGISIGQAWDRLENIQNERPLALQIGSEVLMDPLNVVPLGLFTKPGRAAIKGVRSLGRRADDITERTTAGISQGTGVISGEITDPTRSYLSLPSAGDIGIRINHTQFRDKVAKIPGLGRLIGQFAPHVVMNLDNHADEFISHKLVMDELIEDKISIETRNLRGLHGKQFDYDDDNFVIGITAKELSDNQRFALAMIRTDPSKSASSSLVETAIGVAAPRADRFMEALPRYLRDEINREEFVRLSGYKSGDIATQLKVARRSVLEDMINDPKSEFMSWYKAEHEELFRQGKLKGAISRSELDKLLDDDVIKDQVDRLIIDPNRPYTSQIGAMRRARVGIEAKAATARQGRFTINEIAQNPDRFNLSTSQRSYLDDVNKLFDDMRDYIIKENADPNELLLSPIKGKYHPNLWQMMDGIQDVQKGNLDPVVFGKKKFFENTRLYDYASDAVDNGFRPGDFDETVRIALKGMYQMVEERRLADIIGKWSPDIKKRLTSKNNMDLEDILTDLGKLEDTPKSEIDKIRKGLNPKANAWVEGSYNISTAMRTMMATMDLGAPLLHGLPILLTAPRIWAKSVKNSFDAMVHPEVFDKFITDHMDTLRKLNDRNQLHGSGIDAIEAIGRDGILTRQLQKAKGVPGLKKPAGYAQSGLGLVERQFESFLIASKVMLWESLEDTAITHAQKQFAKFGGDLAGRTHQALDELASHIAKSTGTVSMANLGLRPSRRKAMAGFFMFAPRYRMASYGLMADMVNVGRNGSAGSLSGELARKRLSGMLMSGLLFHTYLARRMGQEPNIDPSSGDFLTVELPGGENVGFGSVWVSTARFLAGVTDVSMDDPLADIGGKANVFSRDNPLTRFVRGQIAPISGAGWDIITGRNFIGDPMPETYLSGEGLGQGLEYVTPFWISGMWQHPDPGWSLGHIGGAVAPTMAGEFFGLRTYPTSVWEQATDAADITAQRMYKKNYEDLRRLEKEKVRTENPNIQELYDQSDAIFAARGNEVRKQVSQLRSEQRRIKIKYKDELKELAARWNRPLHKGTDARLLGKDFRDRLSVLGQGIGSEYDSLKTRFPDAMTALNDEAQNPAAAVEDIAYNEYIAELVVKEFTFPGSDEYDYESRREAEKNFRNKWGASLWGYIMERKNYDIPPEVMELKEGRAILQPYWEMGDLILEEKNMNNMRPIWKEYQQLPVFEQREMEDLYPILRQIRSAVSKARQMLREQNQSIDAFAFKYGYTDILRHPENILDGEEEILRSRVDVRWPTP